MSTVDRLTSRVTLVGLTHLSCPLQGPGMWVTLVAAVAAGVALVIGAVAALRRKNGA